MKNKKNYEYPIVEVVSLQLFDTNDSEGSQPGDNGDDVGGWFDNLFGGNNTDLGGANE